MAEILKRPLRVFLCHAAADKPVVRKLSRRLAAEGWIDPWLDEEKLSLGQDWETAIENALDAADIVIIFLSNNSVHKEGFVQRELNYAWELSLEKLPSTIFLIPLRLDDCEVPRRLGSRHWGDFFGDKEESAYQKLLRSLEERYQQKIKLETKEQKQQKSAEEIKLDKLVRKPLPLPKSVTRISPQKENNNYKKRMPGTIIFLTILLLITLLVSALYLRDNYMSSLAQVQATPTSTVLTSLSPQDALDKSLGITRLHFNRAFNSNLGIEISHMAASETDLYLLNAANGEALRAQPSTNGQGFQLDTTFNCKPGVYGNYTVGNLVDILTLPVLNSVNATLLGIDEAGNLLYCTPGRIAQAIPLPPPDTNWNRVTAFTLDGGNLYVLDALARGVWAYNGKDGTFIDRPYFFLGGQTPEQQNIIDLIVSGDDLYTLDADGHFYICSYSRIESKATICNYLSELPNPFPLYEDVDLFAKAYITQMTFAPLPNTSIFMLDSASKGVLRVNPTSMELLGQLRSVIVVEYNPLSSGSLSAMTVGPNHVLYLAVSDQIYYATDIP